MRDRVRSTPEVRPANTQANSTRGTSPNGRFPRVDGDFTGTTDEIIQWVACKWGIDEDLVRAQVVAESYWFQRTLGDFTSDPDACIGSLRIGNYPGHSGQCPESVGLGQVRWLYHLEAFDGRQRDPLVRVQPRLHVRQLAGLFRRRTDLAEQRRARADLRRG